MIFDNKRYVSLGYKMQHIVYISHTRPLIDYWFLENVKSYLICFIINIGIPFFCKFDSSIFSNTKFNFSAF